MSGPATISIPEQFVIMSDEMEQIKYLNGNTPKEVYTNKEGSINVALSETGSPLIEEEIVPLIEEMIAMFTILCYLPPLTIRRS